MTTLCGVYRQGRIELIDPPVDLREGPVRVLVLEEGTKEPRHFLTFGKYRSGALSSLESFTEAEWRREEFP
jgi:hypothetical protein